MIALEGLNRYDDKRPLENFLWTHVKNRLGNFKRDNWERLSKPCLKCPLLAFDSVRQLCTVHEDLLNCDPYRKWFSKTTAKKNIISFASIENIDYEHEENMATSEDDVERGDKAFVLNVVEENLPEDLLPVYYDFMDRQGGSQEIGEKTA